MKSSVNVLLLGLAIADNLFLLGRVFTGALPSILVYYNISEYDDFYKPFIYGPCQVLLKGGEYMVGSILSTFLDT